MALTPFINKSMLDYMSKGDEKKIPKGITVLSRDKEGLTSFLYKGWYYGSVKGLYFVEGYRAYDDGKCVIVSYSYDGDNLTYMAKYNKVDNSLIAYKHIHKGNSISPLCTDKEFLLYVGIKNVYHKNVYLFNWDNDSKVEEYPITYYKQNVNHYSMSMYICNKDGVSYIASEFGLFKIDGIGDFKVLEDYSEVGYILVEDIETLEKVYIHSDGTIAPYNDSELTKEEHSRVVNFLMNL